MQNLMLVSNGYYGILPLASEWQGLVISRKQFLILIILFTNNYWMNKWNEKIIWDCVAFWSLKTQFFPINLVVDFHKCQLLYKGVQELTNDQSEHVRPTWLFPLLWMLTRLITPMVFHIVVCLKIELLRKLICAKIYYILFIDWTCNIPKFYLPNCSII